LAASAVALGTVGAVAYACSGTLSDYTYVTPSSGTHGQSLTVQTWTQGGQLDSKASFYFRYAPPGDPTACPAEPTGIGASVKPTSGNILTVSRTISNLGSVGGTGYACWSVTGSTALNQIAAPAAITVN
jgi:hypothetical protein